MTSTDQSAAAHPSERVPADSWEAFCDDLRDLGRRVTTTTGSERDHAEGLRFLTHLLRSNLERHLDGEPGNPRFIRVGPALKYLADNPDTLYDSAALSPHRSYRVTGTRGEALYLSFTLYGGGQDVRIVADLNDEQLQYGADGEFEILLSPEPQPGNWMKLDDDSHMLIVRQYFHDRDRQTAATYRIEPVGPAPTTTALTAGELTERMARVRRGTGLLLSTTLEQLAQLRSGQPNAFGGLLAAEHEEQGSVILRAYPTPDNDYVTCRYLLEEDEALVLRFQPPPCRYWSVHLTNLWWQSPEHGITRASVNSGNATLEPDGSARVVISHRDPGTPDWLNTAGRPEGSVLVRWLLPEQKGVDVRPQAEVVPVDHLRL